MVSGDLSLQRGNTATRFWLSTVWLEVQYDVSQGRQGVTVIQIQSQKHLLQMP